MVSFFVKNRQALASKDSKAFGAGIGKVVFKVAERWFSLLDDVKDIASLRQDLTDHTLVGHLLSADKDNLQDQIIMYTSDRLVFTAIVGNKSHRIALLPEQTSSILTKHNLPLAQTKSLGVCTTYSEMCDTLSSAHREVSTTKTSDVNEGAIFWLVRRSDKQMGDRVLSLSQVESLEFVMLRELKMSLRSFMKSTAQKGYRQVEMQADQLKQTFIGTSQRLSGSFQTQIQKMLDHFFELLITALNQLNEKTPKDYNARDKATLFEINLHSNFPEFLSEL
jgi:hypothetical protein